MFVSCITSAPIVYAFEEYDLYDSFDLVARGVRHARLVPNARTIIASHRFPFNLTRIKKIFTAEAGQTVETAQLFVDTARSVHATVIPTPLLNPIRFALTNLMPKEIFAVLPRTEALRILRIAFLRHLYRNGCDESFEEVQSRIRSFCMMLGRERSPALCIGHSFFLRMVEIFLRDPNVFSNLSVFVRSFHPNTRPYESLQGFVTRIGRS